MAIDLKRLIREYGGKEKNGVWEIPYRRTEFNTDGYPYADCHGTIRFDPKDPNSIWRNGTGKYLKGSGILFGRRDMYEDDYYGVSIPTGMTYEYIEKFLGESGIKKKNSHQPFTSN